MNEFYQHGELILKYLKINVYITTIFEDDLVHKF